MCNLAFLFRMTGQNTLSTLARLRFKPGRLIFLLLAGLLVLFLFLPLFALVLRAVPLGLDAWMGGNTLAALQLSLITASLSTVIAFGVGTPVAYLLAREQFFGKSIIDTLIDLPMVLPPAVAGIALLMAFGRRGLLGPTLSAFGIELPFTTLRLFLPKPLLPRRFM